jgi:hypothetical protein
MEPLNTRGLLMAPSNSLSQTMRRFPLFFYFFLAFGFTWVYELTVYRVLLTPGFSLRGVFSILVLRLDLLWPHSS